MKKTEILSIPIDELHEHPDNPRKDLGDLTDLAASIKESGVLQNLTVIVGSYITQEEWARTQGDTPYNPHIPIGPGYTIIIGHRRAAAARLADLSEVPAALVNMDYKTQLATMMAENVQRTDLTPFEQANGFQLMMDLGMSVSDVANKTGFTESVVRRRLKLANVDASNFGGNNYTLFDVERCAKIKDKSDRDKLYRLIGTDEFGAAIMRAERNQTERDIVNKVKRLIMKAKPDIDFCSSWNISDSPYYQYRSLKCYRFPIESIDLTDIPEEAIAVSIQVDKYDLKHVSIHFGKEQPKKEAEKPLTDVQKKNIEIKEARIKKLTETTALYRELRAEFIRNVPVAKIKENLSLVAEAIGYTANTSISYYVNGTLNRFYPIIDSSPYAGDYPSKLAALMSNDPEPARALLIYAYSILSPTDKAAIDYFDKGKNGGVYNPSANLDLAYKILLKLGYKVCEEEAQLRDGTSPLYKKAYYYKNLDEPTSDLPAGGSL